MNIATQLLPEQNILLNHQRELTLLALCVWAEARGEPDEGKTAVAHTVMNRWKRQSWYGDTVANVILKPFQFSSFNEGSSVRDSMISVKNDESWGRCAQAAWDAYLGVSGDPTGGATHFCREDCEAEWRESSTMEYCCRIGRHVFYREMNEGFLT